MKKVVSVDVMRESDAFTIKNYTDSKALMYRAGEGVFKSYPWRGKTAIVCGSGNNAGDGYVLALLLKKHSIPCTLFLLKESFSEDGRYYFEKCMEEGISWCIADADTDFDGYGEIADCMFGTGFRGAVSGMAEVITDKINSSGKTVISVDINSGLNGNSGTAEKCVCSDLTVSIGYLKSGFFINDAPSEIKRLVNWDIGIKLKGKSYTLIEKNDSREFVKNCVPVLDIDFPKGYEPIEEMQKTASEKSVWIRCENVLTNGAETYIFEV